MKARLDDVTYSIEFLNNKGYIMYTEDIKEMYLFDKAIKALLTPLQWEDFIGDETRRTFNISERRFIKFEKILKDNGYGTKQH